MAALSIPWAAILDRCASCAPRRSLTWRRIAASRLEAAPLRRASQGPEKSAKGRSHANALFALRGWRNIPAGRMTVAMMTPWRSREENGGHGRNRTGVHGFAGRCVTTPPRGLWIKAERKRLLRCWRSAVLPRGRAGVKAIAPAVFVFSIRASAGEDCAVLPACATPLARCAGAPGDVCRKASFPE